MQQSRQQFEVHQPSDECIRHGSLASSEKRRRPKQAAAALGGTVSFTTSAGASDAVTRLIKRIGERARAALPLGVHVHMLRHARGYALANAGHDTRRIQDWLGHRSIQHTTRYTQLSSARFKDFWR
jgi:type 1 fimbriae regulatory protein FimB/type 1 fimbriae regulatory protein FimE